MNFAQFRLKYGTNNREIVNGPANKKPNNNNKFRLTNNQQQLPTVGIQRTSA